MIKAERSTVTVSGTPTELMSELTKIIRAMLEEEVVNEELLDIIVGLGKAEANGTGNDFMKKVLNKINQIKDEIDKKDDEEKEEVKEDLNDIMDKIKELLEEDED